VKTRAPGKLLLSGAYAVLDGAPALVVAVNRYAIADGAITDDSPMEEVRSALQNPPRVDVTQLRDGDNKLGLGSSAAATVAALAVREAERGAELADDATRHRLMHQAWAAHARVQGGGSGVDVAASTFGGALSYVRGETPTPVRLPNGLVWRVFFSGKSARTSELRAKVDALASTNRSHWALAVRRVADASLATLEACAEDDAVAFVASARASAQALAALGSAADAPIVTHETRVLAELAESEGGVFMPSGAGGGDCSIFFSTSLPSTSFVDHATRLSQSMLAEISLDLRGVHVSP